MVLADEFAKVPALVKLFLRFTVEVPSAPVAPNESVAVALDKLILPFISRVVEPVEPFNTNCAEPPDGVIFKFPSIVIVGDKVPPFNISRPVLLPVLLTVRLPPMVVSSPCISTALPPKAQLKTTLLNDCPQFPPFVVEIELL